MAINKINSYYQERVGTYLSSLPCHIEFLDQWLQTGSTGNGSNYQIYFVGIMKHINNKLIKLH